MKRTELRRHTPLRSSKPLARGPGPKRKAAKRRTTALRQRSDSPKARARKAAQEGPQWRLCHDLPCACGCGRWELGAVHGHHEPPRSRGGLDRDTLPLWWECHERRHRLGARRFWVECGKDPAVILADLRNRVAAQVAG